ncbi:MAG: hypothetical protein ACE10E_05690 [Acidiferrobacterales bacterium]|nr:hypothetical protein [Gammaproteobacteria bacterium]
MSARYASITGINQETGRATLAELAARTTLRAQTPVSHELIFVLFFFSPFAELQVRDP